MTFSNFKPLGSRFAEIDITTGMWWWKRTMTVMIERFRHGFYQPQWLYRDGGQWCPRQYVSANMSTTGEKHE